MLEKKLNDWTQKYINNMKKEENESFQRFKKIKRTMNVKERKMQR